MASTKKKQYDTSGLTSKDEVQDALNSAQYNPSQAVTDAENALKEWQNNRPADYESKYQDQIDSLLQQASQQKDFSYNYAQDPMYQQYARMYTQNAHHASTDAAAHAAALPGGYSSSYAASVAQQAYQQQMNALNSIIPTLYNMALDSYTSQGDQLFNEIELVSAQEQSAQNQYYRQLEDYYTQLEQKGQAYNDAYAKDYNEYTDYLAQLGSMRDYYVQQEQYQNAQKQQTFQNVMSVLGLIGDAIQLAISGTTGLGSLANGLLQTGYGIYAGNRDYEAQREDAAWDQQMEALLRQDSLTQQAYENETAQREYQDALAQQKFDNDVTSQKLAIAQGEWALKQAQAAEKASEAAARSQSSSSGLTTGSTGYSGASPSSGSGAQTRVPYSALRMQAQGKSSQQIINQLTSEGYTSAQIKSIMQMLNQ